MLRLRSRLGPKSVGPARALALAVALSGAMGTQLASAQSVMDYAGRWTFDDCSTSSTILKDVSGNNGHGVRGGNLVCTSDFDGRANGAVSLTVAQPGDGSTAQTVTVLNTAAFTIANKVSVSAKIRPGTTPAGAIITKGWMSGATPRKTFQLAIAKDGSGNNRLSWTVWFLASGSSTPLPINIKSSVNIAASTWTRVGASYDNVNGFALFVNGVQVGTGPVLDGTIADAPTPSTAKLWVGGNVPALPQGPGYLGAVDDVWVSNGSCVDNSARTPVVSRELMIKHINVVEDKVRTQGMGAWTFGHLVEQMVPASGSVDAAADMVEAMLNTWAADVTVNGSIARQRSAMASKVLGVWARTSTHKLDLNKSPLRLLAIVNRIDKRNLAQGHAGEGRLVFGVLDAFGGNPTQFTMILEYKLVAETSADLRIWARSFHDLGTQVAGTAGYNTALQAITDRFVSRGANPKGINGNGLNQLRTNEISVAPFNEPWELRQFELAIEAGKTRLKPAPLTQTPELTAFNRTDVLERYINANAALIKKGTHVVGPSFQGTTPFQAAASPIPSGFFWDGPVPGRLGEDLRFNFAVNTCNGCHFRETQTGFTHVAPRGAGEESVLSAFLTGSDEPFFVPSDPTFTQTRDFNDLERRKLDFRIPLLCPSGATSVAGAATLSKGIDRVH